MLSCEDKEESIDNNVPVALIVAVTPSVPTLNDSLVLSYFYFDVEKNGIRTATTMYRAVSIFFNKQIYTWTGNNVK